MVGEHLRQGLDDVTSDLVGYGALTIAFALTVVLTCGLGLLLAPNYVRAVLRAQERGAGPDVLDLYDFSHLVDLLLLGLLAMVVSMLGNVLPVVGPLVGGTLLLWTPWLVADGHYRPVEAAQASVRAVVREPVETAAFQLAVLVLVGVSMVPCLLPLLLVTVPVATASTGRFYASVRSEVLLVGDQAGLTRR